jgi:hypothetical protein
MSTILTCAFALWSPGLGDNHPVGWVTVAVYLVAAYAAARTAVKRIPVEAADRRERLFWSGAALVLLILGINKQLDLQSLVTAIGRCHAQLAGWYDDRRAVQRTFILLVAVAGLVTLCGLTVSLRRILDRIWLALVGLVFVCLFVVIRAASFHHFDVLIGSTTAGLRLNWVLELPGPLVVLIVALRRSRTGLPRPTGAATNQDGSRAEGSGP